MVCSRTQGETNDLTTSIILLSMFDDVLTTVVILLILLYCRNGPVGSAVCVYTLDHTSNDVTRVFNGDYLSRVSSTTWQRADNDNPFTVSIM